MSQITTKHGVGYKMKTFLLACLCATLAFSQESNGRIDGTVTDPAGAAVPAAQVTVTFLATD